LFDFSNSLFLNHEYWLWLVVLLAFKLDLKVRSIVSKNRILLAVGKLVLFGDFFLALSKFFDCFLDDYAKQLANVSLVSVIAEVGTLF